MLSKILFTFTGVTTTAFALGQEPTDTTAPKPKITAAVDVYYRHNFSNPQQESNTYNNYTSFTNSQKSFELGMATIKFEHAIGKVGMTADIGFGKRAEEFSYADDKTRFAIKQLFISYAPMDNLKISAGSWATHLGYEVVDAYANKNYSMSYMFSKGPFLHTGIKADYTFGKNNLMLGFADPTDLKSASFSRKYFLAQYGFHAEGGQFNGFLNFQAGKADSARRVRQIDLVVTEAISKKFTIGYNATVASVQNKISGKFHSPDSWWGTAIYINNDLSSTTGLALRAEYFKDTKLLTDVFAVQPQGGSVFAATLSANIRINDLTLIPELRHDAASQPVFINSKGNNIKNTMTALVAAVYKF